MLEYWVLQRSLNPGHINDTAKGIFCSDNSRGTGPSAEKANNCHWGLKEYPRNPPVWMGE